ncbi:Methionyl/Leucyl tRNA synthetase domain-containing protein [Rozella allomycis CSF55]|uniref:methionine--tRNA ligase n=1 Tax=Rozella allomycis (strain CSF55) TaxID=988480 RepID=A0A075ANE7_ROZAC|nr:Methionyl/Leucyl tRNA synthetase domain-containing protein [Rozella allomycis CSF55]|eukprot:EPZ31324.1 Methionyl/Leucyl tRNA synthetase domain-containing protein [Rozella allomycis CSF55]
MKSFISTPIFYVNAEPHIGHAYSLILADTITRVRNLCGAEKTLLVTGTDEHGQKIMQASLSRKMTPKELCDQQSGHFHRLANIVTHNNVFDFIRTTEPRHKESVLHFWGSHKGWYCTEDEAFYTNVKEVTIDNERVMVSEETGRRVHMIEEPNYRFRLPKYLPAIFDWIKSSQAPLEPAVYTSEILHTIESLENEDLSVSRCKSRVPWGIEVPGDPDQTIYVWLDALINYLTVSGYPNEERLHWPPTHVIGKDISKFHCIYWPAFLLSAGLSLPKKIIIHSHWTMNGRKMSKSDGNVINPFNVIDAFGVDALRYFLLKEGYLRRDSDIDISANSISATYKSDLMSYYGNMFSRIFKTPFVEEFPALIEPITENDKELYEEIERWLLDAYNECKFSQGVLIIMEMLAKVNTYFTDMKPWELKQEKKISHLNRVMYMTFESFRIISLLFQPLIPNAASKVLDHMGILDRKLTPENLRIGYDYRNSNVKSLKENLFPKK